MFWYRRLKKWASWVINSWKLMKVSVTVHNTLHLHPEHRTIPYSLALFTTYRLRWKVFSGLNVCIYHFSHWTWIQHYFRVTHAPAHNEYSMRNDSWEDLTEEYHISERNSQVTWRCTVLLQSRPRTSSAPPSLHTPPHPPTPPNIKWRKQNWVETSS